MTETTKVEQFLESFFGDGNEFSLEAAQDTTKTLGAWLEPWLRDLRSGDRLPAVLPRQLDSGEVVFYGLAFSERQARALRDDLVAFVGPTYSTFRGQQAALDPTDPVEKSIRGFAATTYRFQAHPSHLVKQVREVLTLMQQVWHDRPSLEPTSWRPTGRILRDFEMALQAQHESEAVAALEELRSQGRLTAANLLFLEIRKLAAFGKWRSILELEQLPTVLQARRPHLVTQDVIRAVYAEELGTFEQQGQPGQAVEAFRGTLLPRYAALFQTRGSMTAPEAIKGFMLAAAAMTPQRPALRDELLEIAQREVSGSELDYVQELAAFVTELPRTIAGVLEAARDAVERAEFDEALGLLSEADNSRERLELLIRCAYEVQTLESSQAVIEGMQNLSLEDRDALLASRWYREQWDALLRGQEPTVPIPSNWTEWVRRLFHEGSWSEAVSIATQGADEWSMDDLAQPGEVQELADLLNGIPQADARETLRQSLPHLMRFFLRGIPQREIQPIYDALFMQLAVDERTSDSDLSIMLDLLEALVATGLDMNGYRGYVDSLREIWVEKGSVSRLDWALEALDTLIELPASDPDSRLRFMGSVIAGFQRWARRAASYQWELLEILCGDLGVEAELQRLAGIRAGTAAPDDQDLQTLLKGKKVAIYTLTESVARRVRETLERMVEGVSVSTSSDKVGSDRLRQLAREADIFLVSTRSATHAATEFIDANRPKGSATLRPDGKGSASMIRKLLSP